MQDLFNNKLGIGNVVIERAHRVFSSNDQDTQENKDRRPKTIVLKLLNYKDKVKVFRNVNKLKESGIYITEDFCKETTDRRKELWKEVKVLRDQGKYAVIRYDRIVQQTVTFIFIRNLIYYSALNMIFSESELKTRQERWGSFNICAYFFKL